jgi:diaminopimelate decarboxylase
MSGEYLDVSVGSMGKSGKWRFTKVGSAKKGEYQGQESITIYLEPGIALVGGEGTMITIKQRQPREGGDGPF